MEHHHFSWENDGKSPFSWENYGKSLFSMGKPWKITIFNGKTMENSLFQWPFSIAFCKFTIRMMLEAPKGDDLKGGKFQSSR